MTKEKESVLDLDKEQIILYNDIYKLISPYIKPDDPDSLLMTSGTLLAVSIQLYTCLLYTSPSPRDGLLSRMPSSA